MGNQYMYAMRATALMIAGWFALISLRAAVHIELVTDMTTPDNEIHAVPGARIDLKTQLTTTDQVAGVLYSIIMPSPGWEMVAREYSDFGWIESSAFDLSKPTPSMVPKIIDNTTDNSTPEVIDFHFQSLQQDTNSSITGTRKTIETFSFIVPETIALGEYTLIFSQRFPLQPQSFEFDTGTSLPTSTNSGLKIIICSAGTAESFPFKAGWNLFALPFSICNNSVADILFNLSPPNSSSGPIWEWNGSQLIPATTLVPGNGYWIYLKQPATLNVNGILADPDPMSITTGWHLLGPISAQVDLRINPDVAPVFWFWNGRKYQTDSILHKNRAYWIHANRPATIDLAP